MTESPTATSSFIAPSLQSNRLPLYERWRDPRSAQLIKGNVTLEMRQRILELCSSHFTRRGRGFGDGIISRLEIVEMTVSEGRDKAQVVCDIDVKEDMSDLNGKVTGGCLSFLASLISGFPDIVLDLSKGGAGAKGAAQVLDIMIHSQAHVKVTCLSLSSNTGGDRLRITGHTLGRDHSASTGRCEIWSVTHGKLIATASQIKANGSAVNSGGRLTGHSKL